MDLLSPFRKKPKIAVLYLARKAEGIAPLQKFLTSYNAYKAGIDHDLVVLFKGFDNTNDLLFSRAEFASIPHIAIELADKGFDLGSYFAASGQVPHEYICCLNTFSEILSDDWLAKLYSHASKPDVGLVGATGSYESVANYIMLLQKVIWLNSQKIPAFFRAQIKTYFREFFPDIFSDAIDVSFLKFPYLYTRKSLGCIKRAISRWISSDNFNDEAYVKWWEKTKKLKDIASMCQFPLFPNPHIRSNAFMIRRDKFLSLKKREFLSKIDACLFESGPESMTRQILRSGLKAQIVGHNGEGYDVNRWASSYTFRLGGQENLLVKDNQTHSFAIAGRETQIVQILSTWGDTAITLPIDFPDLGFSFKTNASCWKFSQEEK